MRCRDRSPLTAPPAVFLLLAIGLVGVGGCGPQLAEVRGRVTLQGQPLSDGSAIVFSNEERGTFIQAPLNEDGRFRVEMAEGWGLPPGTYEVSVIPPPLTGPPQADGKQPGQTVRSRDIPMKYRDPKTSDLRLELPRGGAVFNVEMQP